MAKSNSTIKTAKVKAMSKTLSGSDCIVSFQEDQGRVHTLYLSKEESSAIDLGDTIQIIIAKVDITQ
jgi:hypothetical protein